jgi:hypothetical protein
MAIHRQRRGKSPPLSKKFAARMIRTRAEVLLPEATFVGWVAIGS